MRSERPTAWRALAGVRLAARMVRSVVDRSRPWSPDPRRDAVDDENVRARAARDILVVGARAVGPEHIVLARHLADIVDHRRGKIVANPAHELVDKRLVRRVKRKAQQNARRRGVNHGPHGVGHALNRVPRVARELRDAIAELLLNLFGRQVAVVDSGASGTAFSSSESSLSDHSCP